MSLKHKSQSALEYMMTYGWAILVIVIVAAVLYSLGIFSPSSSLSTTITGFSNLGTVNAVCLGGTSFTISMGDSTGYPINVTEINLTSSSGKTTYSPNILIQPNSIQTVTVPSSSLCTSGARYSVSAVISYLEPGQIFPGPYTSTGTVAGTANSPPSSATYYEPLNITNTQNQGTPSPFQQMINVTSTSPGWGDISSSPFGQNVEFFSATGQILDSWLENYTSTHAIWWVKLTSSIPAGSKQIIYMGFAPTSTNLFNTNNIGEAPQLSSTYGEYNSIRKVFINGTIFTPSEENKLFFNNGNQSLTYFDNGITLWSDGGSTSPSIYTGFSVDLSTEVVMADMNITSQMVPQNNFYIGEGQSGKSFFLQQVPTTSTTSPFIVVTYGIKNLTYWSSTYGLNYNPRTPTVYSIWQDNNEYYGSFSCCGLSQTVEQTGILTILFNSNVYMNLYSSSGQNESQHYYWLAIRNMAYNNSMPSVSFGSVS